MIVEFIGSSGAGKTTLIELLQRPGGTTAPVVSAADLIMDRPGRRWIHHPKAVNVVADVTVFPSFLRTLGRNGDFVRFAFHRLRRHAPSTFAKYNYMRQVVRDVGKHELAKRAGASATVLVDEGAVLTAYHLFVYSDAPFDRWDLERFAHLVPLPDRIVYVRAPVDVLVDRAIRRRDRRRELVELGRDDVARWIARAEEVFEGLAATHTLRDRTLTVDNGDGSSEARAAIVSRIAAFIHDRTPTDRAGRAPVSPGAP